MLASFSWNKCENSPSRKQKSQSPWNLGIFTFSIISYSLGKNLFPKYYADFVIGVMNWDLGKVYVYLFVTGHSASQYFTPNFPVCTPFI